MGTVATSIRNEQIPGGRRYTVRDYRYGGKLLAQHYIIDGMGHAWSGGDGSLPFTDPAGPDASVISWVFMSGFTR